MEAARRYLVVPFSERELARSLGAIWDKETRCWFAFADGDLEPLARWLPGSPAMPSKLSHARDDPRREFAVALRSAGLRLEDLPEMDGRLRRLPVEGDKGLERSGAYVGHLDGHPAGFIQNHKTGLKLTWKSSQAREAFDERSRAVLIAQAAQRRHQRERERRSEHERTAKALVRAWSRAATVDGMRHPYLSRKNVKSWGLRADEKGGLLVPLRDITGKLWSLQTIRPDGTKTLAKNSRMIGNFFVMGPLEDTESVFIAEGYATAATLLEALPEGLAAVVAFGAGNLLAVSGALREKYPQKSLFIAADDDRAREREGKPNVGRVKAEEAARAVGGHVFLPRFDAEENGSDWNDLALSKGIGDVRKQLRALLSGGHGRTMSREIRMSVEEQGAGEHPGPPRSP